MLPRYSRSGSSEVISSRLRTIKTVSKAKVMSSESKMPKSASSFAAPVSSQTTSLPRRLSSMPRRIRQKPMPPASTTPAFLRTGFWLTVLSSAACAVSRQCWSTYSISQFSSARSRAASAVRRETVRMVPSAGFMTAL